MSNPNTEGGWMDQKTRPVLILPTRDQLDVERHRETENKRDGNRYFMQTEIF